MSTDPPRRPESVLAEHPTGPRFAAVQYELGRDHLAAVARDQCPQHDRVDRVLDEADRAIDHQRVESAGLMAAQFAAEGLDGLKFSRIALEGDIGLGLVQGTASRASTRPIVFEVPSVIVSNPTPVGALGSKSACSPAKPRK